jgi:hypothetical protein
VTYDIFGVSNITKASFWFHLSRSRDCKISAFAVLCNSPLINCHDITWHWIQRDSHDGFQPVMFHINLRADMAVGCSLTSVYNSNVNPLAAEQMCNHWPGKSMGGYECWGVALSPSTSIRYPFVKLNEKFSYSRFNGFHILAYSKYANPYFYVCIKICQRVERGHCSIRSHSRRVTPGGRAVGAPQTYFRR